MNFAFQEFLPNAMTGNQRRTTFEEQYHCFSMAVSGRPHLEDGDKILLPPSALDVLARMNVAYPMLFELSNSAVGKRTHCGVLEFTAEEGRCYIPFWMMHNLFMEEGALITAKNVTLPKAKFVKFQAQSVDFLKINNPRAVLEVTLRKFTCVTKGDMICIPYADKKYHLEVTDVKPQDAVSIVEADFNVDFDEPVGYQESEYGKAERAAKERKLNEELEKEKALITPRTLQKATIEETLVEKKFIPFAGSARRIDGKKKEDNNNNNVKDNNNSVKDNNNSNGGGYVLGRSSNTSSPSITSSNTSNNNNDNHKRYQSNIGTKFSKNKTAVSVYTGTGRKLNG
eukprot:TRINITY_DN22558_c0_g1_i1.p1 TRINITY_DN22558_c0_g1~~TRINITY_DN22558_c0_g1_i1.p1  ORF type:complete len:341 (-),score=19.64 TRINITY_DN22558_c0_g1_i1:24-1046(-)